MGDTFQSTREVSVQEDRLCVVVYAVIIVLSLFQKIDIIHVKFAHELTTREILNGA